MNKDIILHVGMHKTGTTYLQEHVFPKLDDTYLVSLHTKSNPILDFIRRLSSQNILLMDLQEERRKLEEFISGLPQSKILISYETLFGFYMENYLNNKLITDALKIVFPQAKIFLCIRKQDDWLESAYKQTIHAGLSISIEHFLNFETGDFKAYVLGSYKGGANFDVRTLNYPCFIRYYWEAFGKSNVLVLPFEMLRKERETFLKTFYEFNGITPYYPEGKDESNKGYSLLSAHLALWANKLPMKRLKRKKLLRARLEKTIDRWFYIKHNFIKPEVRQRIMDMHLPDNHQTAELLDMDLQKYGYY